MGEDPLSTVAGAGVAAAVDDDVAAQLSAATHALRADAWERVLAEDPDLMADLIADVLKVVAPRDPGRTTGRLPAAPAVDVRGLYARLFPARLSADPLPVALRALVGTTAQTEFARRVPCSQAALSWYMAGRRVPDAPTMARLAAAGGVTPAYFREWRAWWLAEQAAAHPAATAAALRRLGAAARDRDRARDLSRGLPRGLPRGGGA